MKTEFKVNQSPKELIVYTIVGAIFLLVVYDNISFKEFDVINIIAIVNIFLILQSTISLLFPRKIYLKDKYLESTFLFNKVVIPYSELKIFLRKNFLTKIYVITDKKRQRKIMISNLKDSFIEDFENYLEKRLIESKGI